MKIRNMILIGGGILLLIAITVLTTVLIVNRASSSDGKQQQATETQSTEAISENKGMNTGNVEGETAMQADLQEIDIAESEKETEPRKKKAIIFNIDSLISFLSAEQLEDVKQQLTELIPENADQLYEVSCMSYQEVSSKDMTVTFYLQDSANNVYAGYYNFKSAGLLIGKAPYSVEDIEQLREKAMEQEVMAEQKAREEATKRLESERAAESEKKAESEKEKSEKEDKKEKQKK